MNVGLPRLQETTARSVRHLPVTPEAAWQYLEREPLRASWLGPGRLELWEGGELDLVVHDPQGEEVRVQGRVLEVHAPHFLRLSWQEAGGSPEQVTFQLEPDEHGTRFQVVHDRAGTEAGRVTARVLPGALLALLGTVDAGRAAPGGTAAASPAAGSSSYAASTLRGGSRALRPRAHHAPWVVYAVVAVMAIAGIGGAVGYELSLHHAALTVPAACTPQFLASPVSEPGPAGDLGWERVTSNTCVPWNASGAPVLLYVGSLACPYCAASSWPLAGAMGNFSLPTGPLGPYSTSSPNDVYPSTPEVDLLGVTQGSPVLAPDMEIGASSQSIQVPSLSGLAQEYFSKFDPGGGIPFLVVGGIYVHLGSLVAPSNLTYNGLPLSPATVASDLGACAGNFSWGPVCHALLLPQLYLEAYLYKVDLIAGLAPPIAYLSQDPADLSTLQQIVATLP